MKHLSLFVVIFFVVYCAFFLQKWRFFCSFFGSFFFSFFCSFLQCRFWTARVQFSPSLDAISSCLQTPEDCYTPFVHMHADSFTKANVVRELKKIPKGSGSKKNYGASNQWLEKLHQLQVDLSGGSTTISTSQTWNSCCPVSSGGVTVNPANCE